MLNTIYISEKGLMLHICACDEMLHMFKIFLKAPNYSFDKKKTESHAKNKNKNCM